MTVREFRDNDAGYLTWLAAHPDGHVINIARSHKATEARVHRAACRTIRGENPRGGTWTAQYVKVCAKQLDELDQWAVNLTGEPFPRCKNCHLAGQTVELISTTPTQPTEATAPEIRFTVHGPEAGSPVVQAWADDYIHFQSLPPSQKRLRAEIRTRCEQLEPSNRQVLHATFYGPKRSNADVENLVLYNVGTFAIAGRNGIRFEHGAGAPTALGGAEYPFCYRYALEPCSASFAEWQSTRTLAKFDWTDVHSLPSQKEAAPVWLALARERARIEEFETAREPEMPFAVKVQVRAPHGLRRALGGSLKGIFDGVISAFQAHTDTTVLTDVATRLAAILPADPEEVEKHLADQRHAVLGDVHRLVSPYGKGVQWHPADHQCVAGELLYTEPVGPRWAIKGEIIELSPRPTDL